MGTSIYLLLLVFCVDSVVVLQARSIAGVVFFFGFAKLPFFHHFDSKIPYSIHLSFVFSLSLPLEKSVYPLC